MKPRGYLRRSCSKRGRARAHAHGPSSSGAVNEMHADHSELSGTAMRRIASCRPCLMAQAGQPGLSIRPCRAHITLHSDAEGLKQASCGNGRGRTVAMQGDSQ